MKILHLTLKRKWFDMIASGQKLHEYREIKPYWTKRLGNPTWINAGTPTAKERYWFHHFDIVRFKNGYSKDAPTMDVEFKLTSKGIGIESWGAPDKEVYIIELGKVISVSHPFRNLPHYTIP